MLEQSYQVWEEQNLKKKMLALVIRRKINKLDIDYITPHLFLEQTLKENFIDLFQIHAVSESKKNFVCEFQHQ